MQVVEICQYFSCDTFIALKANVPETFDFELILPGVLSSMGYDVDTFRSNVLELNKARLRAIESSHDNFPFKKSFEYIFQVEDIAFRLADFAPFESSVFRW